MRRRKKYCDMTFHLLIINMEMDENVRNGNEKIQANIRIKLDASEEKLR